MREYAMRVRTSLHRSRTCGRAALACGCLALIAISVQSPASAHIKNGRGWFVGGHTQKPGQDREDADPINVVFKSEARDVFGDQYRVNPPGFLDLWGEGPGDHRHGTMSSVPPTSGLCSEHQGLNYRMPTVFDEREDFNFKTGCGRFGEVDFHIRLWDSEEHDDQYHPEPRNQNTWAVGGVHRDRCCPDRISLKWETAEYVLRKELAELCSRPQWKRLPGSLGLFQGRVSNGRPTRISPVPVPSCDGE